MTEATTKATTKRRFTIAGTGCGLLDYIYGQVNFASEAFQRCRSRTHGDGGLEPGKLSFTEQALDENFKAVADEIKRLKPSTVKGRYVTKATITSTMNPGVPVDPTVIA